MSQSDDGLESDMRFTLEFRLTALLDKLKTETCHDGCGGWRRLALVSVHRCPRDRVVLVNDQRPVLGPEYRVVHLEFPLQLELGPQRAAPSEALSVPVAAAVLLLEHDDALLVLLDELALDENQVSPCP